VASTRSVLEKLNREHEIIEENIHRISDLAEDFEIISRVQDNPWELSIFQFDFLNERKNTLRLYLDEFEKILSLHCRFEEKVLTQLLGESLLDFIATAHNQVLASINYLNNLLLDLSPVGILFNSTCLRQKIASLKTKINQNNSMENSILEALKTYAI